MNLLHNGHSAQHSKREGKPSNKIPEPGKAIAEIGTIRFKENYSNRILSKINDKTYVLKVEDIIYFQILNGVISAFSRSQKEFPLSITTLTELEEKLNPEFFFRINRGEIINLHFVEYFEQFYKDRVSVSMKGTKNNLITSNSRASDFRRWIVGQL